MRAGRAFVPLAEGSWQLGRRAEAAMGRDGVGAARRGRRSVRWARGRGPLVGLGDAADAGVVDGWRCGERQAHVLGRDETPIGPASNSKGALSFRFNRWLGRTCHPREPTQRRYVEQRSVFNEPRGKLPVLI